jgi:hypothetical protein
MVLDDGSGLRPTRAEAHPTRVHSRPPFLSRDMTVSRRREIRSRSAPRHLSPEVFSGRAAGRRCTHIGGAIVSPRFSAVSSSADCLRRFASMRTPTLPGAIQTPGWPRRMPRVATFDATGVAWTRRSEGGGSRERTAIGAGERCVGRLPPASSPRSATAGWCGYGGRARNPVAGRCAERSNQPRQ